jgi:hypothetical protein
VSRGRDPACGRFCQLAAARAVFGGLQQREHFGCCPSLVRGRPCSRAAGSWLLERGPAYARALSDGVTICAPVRRCRQAPSVGRQATNLSAISGQPSFFGWGVSDFFALSMF